MEIVEEWAGCSLDLGLTNSPSANKGLTSWAVAWGLEIGGNATYMEIWRTSASALFEGLQKSGPSDEIQTYYAEAVHTKRTEGYVPVAFGDARRGSIPSFSGGEGIRIAAAGVVSEVLPNWEQGVSRASLEEAMVSFQKRLNQSWTGVANAKILLAELQQIQQRIEAYCETNQDPMTCTQLRESLLDVKTAVQQVLMS